MNKLSDLSRLPNALQKSCESSITNLNFTDGGIRYAVVASDFTLLNFFPSSFLASSPTRRMPRRVRFIRNRLEITFPPSPPPRSFVGNFAVQEVLYERFEDDHFLVAREIDATRIDERHTFAKDRSIPSPFNEASSKMGFYEIVLWESIVARATANYEFSKANFIGTKGRRDRMDYSAPELEGIEWGHFPRGTKRLFAQEDGNWDGNFEFRDKISRVEISSSLCLFFERENRMLFRRASF